MKKFKDFVNEDLKDDLYNYFRLEIGDRLINKYNKSGRPSEKDIKEDMFNVADELNSRLSFKLVEDENFVKDVLRYVYANTFKMDDEEMKTYSQFIKESIRDKMTPKSEEEIYNSLSDKEKVSYVQLKELKNYLSDKFGADFKINKNLDTVRLNIKTDLFWSYIIFDDDKYVTYYESFLSVMNDELILNTKEEVFEFINEKVDKHVKEKMKDLEDSIEKLQSEQSKIEKEYEKIKK